MGISENNALRVQEAATRNIRNNKPNRAANSHSSESFFGRHTAPAGCLRCFHWSPHINDDKLGCERLKTNFRLFDASSWNKDTNRLGINANSTRHGLLPTTCILRAPAVLLGQSWAPVQYQLPGYQPGWYLCCILHHFDAFRHWIHDLLCPSKFFLPRCPVMPVSKSSVTTPYITLWCWVLQATEIMSIQLIGRRPSTAQVPSGKFSRPLPEPLRVSRSCLVPNWIRGRAPLGPATPYPRRRPCCAWRFCLEVSSGELWSGCRTVATSKITKITKQGKLT